MTDSAEHYFIQFCFCKNPELLRRENREIYDALLFRYEKLYEKGRKAKVDLGDINERFMSELFGKQKGVSSGHKNRKQI